MEAKYTSLLYYCEVHWLSRANVILRVFELGEEIAKYRGENHNEDGNLFRNDNFIVKLANLVEIFGKYSVKINARTTNAFTDSNGQSESIL